jgi:hypothetical protein
VNLRYVQRSDALLAFTKFDTTCTIETTGAGSRRTLNFYDRAWAALESQRIPHTMHWGKVHDTSHANLRDRWGGNVAEWLAVRRSFLGPAGQHLFANDLLTKCRLDV